MESTSGWSAGAVPYATVKQADPVRGLDADRPPTDEMLRHGSGSTSPGGTRPEPSGRRPRLDVMRATRNASIVLQTTRPAGVRRVAVPDQETLMRPTLAAFG